MKIIADTHTHTLATDHAYSTIFENTKAACDKGLKIICHTEHAPSMLGAPSVIHFLNLAVLPRYINDVMVVRGAEVNIMNFDGGLDLSENVLEGLEWKIASFHAPCIVAGSIKDHTRTLLNIAENPLVNVMGHMGDERYKSNYKEVIKACAKHGKIVEINSHSFTARKGSRENCPQIAELCAEYGVSVVVSSDAHFVNYIGDFGNALNMLEGINFPEELVLNADYNRFMDKLHEINGGKLKGE